MIFSNFIASSVRWVGSQTAVVCKGFRLVHWQDLLDAEPVGSQGWSCRNPRTLLWSLTGVLIWGFPTCFFWCCLFLFFCLMFCQNWQFLSSISLGCGNKIGMKKILILALIKEMASGQVIGGESGQNKQEVGDFIKWVQCPCTIICDQDKLSSLSLFPFISNVFIFLFFYF